ncbi:carbohydrate ABC transporter permease [Georgenia thermotolerans]|uniref:ABC transporter permease subunit n=1 Tax=Georgenia thermotolerans TaxID=527326 RepID=A0A7J5UUP0_9MICO|nr:sugar ABC transporter permease [Georgenia thermotolerans]KAE8765993.1 ABC transporter permease subunit [Georgenia thermotolerans]
MTLTTAPARSRAERRTAKPRPTAAPRPAAAPRRRRLAPALMVTPALVLAFVFVLLPAVLSFVGSFFRIPLTGGPWEFVGLGNYTALLGDTRARTAITNTAVYSVITIVPSLAIGLALALATDALTRGKALARTLLFLPMTANLVAMAVTFKWIFDLRGGFANQLLGLVGLAPVNWLGSTETSLLTVALVGVWRTASFTMMIFFAGLTTIPGTMNEAARMEGITGWTKLTKITLPAMRPSVIFAVVMAILQSVQAFDTVRVMTDGGPRYSSELIQTLTWRYGFEYFNLGAASALNFLLLVALLAVGVWQRKALLGGEDR